MLLKRIPTILLVLSVFIVHAQSEKEKLKKNALIDVYIYGGIGFATIKDSATPNYNANINSSEVLINYNFSRQFGVATGIGFNQLSANGSAGNAFFHHTRNLLKIPALLTYSSVTNGSIEYFGSIGFYTQNITKDHYQYLSNTTKNNFSGWNFGTQASAGLLFHFSKNTKVGIIFNGQSDFTNFNTTLKGSNQTQKITNLNTIGIVFKLRQ
ncbi:outer membrane beta-barrel protein [Polaribacter tangerinus]|uniref:outer membrane beta-barrel protein n=1 Tax=Polaribacter tangerinus TaxID=1920034 RepID=UPI000B4BEB22|nr:outer membrane beta-barrel protein [Polaribacter tangerinus]